MCIWTSSIVQYSKELENPMFRKLDLFPSSGMNGETYFLGPCTFTQAIEQSWAVERVFPMFSVADT
jgi:hypothetical protein